MVEIQAQPAKIQFINFLVNESHIVFKEPGEQWISISFSPSGIVFKELNQFHLELSVNIRDEEDKFHINLKTTSIFEYPEGSDLEAYKNSYFIINAPAIIFPYLRAYISSLTALSGMPTLNLPTLNLSELGSRLKESIREL